MSKMAGAAESMSASPISPNHVVSPNRFRSSPFGGSGKLLLTATTGGEGVPLHPSRTYHKDIDQRGFWNLRGWE